MLSEVRDSITVLRHKAKLRRLIQEDPGVYGCSWFARDPESSWHGTANVLRVFITVVFAPLFLLVPRPVKNAVVEYFTYASWLNEQHNTPGGILDTAPSGGEKGQYEVTGFQPQWMLKVKYQKAAGPVYERIQWSNAEYQKERYTALSYPMDSAIKLYDESGRPALAPNSTKKHKWSLKQREELAELVLFEYLRARQKEVTPPPVEYVWIDELCLSNPKLSDEKEIRRERKKELGLLTDIFSGAAEVCIFCDAIGCDHTGLDCSWGKRIFTIGEILHSKEVSTLTRKKKNDVIKSIWSRRAHNSAPHFREQMERKAGEGKRWHLYAIMRHAANSGAASWQATIHALVVEVMRRDEETSYLDHKYLGKALNGLLPRRARLQDLGGKNGWKDLNWLLELNQGFYNAAGLAAVCKVAGEDVPEYRWWGKPIEPAEGNERVEPRVTAFPVTVYQQNKAQPALSIVAPETIALKHMLQRDAGGLYHNYDMRGVKVLGQTLWTSFSIVGFGLLLSVNSTGRLAGGLLVLYISCMLYVVLELVASTAYVVRHGWAYLDEKTWDEDPRAALAQQGYDLPTLKMWGDQQIIPNFGSNVENLISGTLFDLESGVYVKVKIIDRPNALVPLAIHGSGITCMLLKRSKTDPTLIACKAGMANLPTYIHAQAMRSGTVFVGGGPPMNGVLKVAEAQPSTSKFLKTADKVRGGVVNAV